jgi:hypothetical protein
MVVKVEEVEQPVPTEWREAFRLIVDDLRYRRLSSKKIGDFTYTIDPADVGQIYANIDAYGETVDRLPEDTWSTSVCRWMGDSWHVLIDLFTVGEGPSDLVLFANAYEDGPSYRFNVESVHVP